MIIAITQRLVLREFRAADAAPLAAINSDAEVMRFVLHPEPWTLSRAQQFIEEYDLYERYGYGRWAVEEKDSGRLIGWCGLKYRPEQKHVDLGYRFARAHWDKGFATEAGAACLRYGFQQLGLQRIVASYIPGNSASHQVLHKLGFQPCGTVSMGGTAYPLLEKFSDAQPSSFLPPPRMETERLLLRDMHLADTRVLFALNNDPDVVKYTGDKAFESVDAAREFFEGKISEYEKAGYGRWSVVLKETGETLGWCGLKFLEEENETDLGYRFFKRHWGRGYATEAAKACVDHGFNVLKLKRIVARSMKENVASVRTLEKCGMKFVREEEFALHPGAMYEIVR